MQECSKAAPQFFTALKAALAALLLFSLPSAAIADELFDAFKAFSAQAQTLAKHAQRASKTARAKPFAPPTGFTMAGELAHGIADFSDMAADLSKRLDVANGPTDLACIYRGMAADALSRLQALQSAENAGAQAAILNEMQALFEDAIVVTPQSAADLADMHDGQG